MESLRAKRANANLAKLLRVKIATIDLAKERGFFTEYDNRFRSMSVAEFGAAIFQNNPDNFYKINRHQLYAVYNREQDNPMSGQLMVWFAYLSDANSQIAVGSIRTMVDEIIKPDQYGRSRYNIKQIVIISSHELHGDVLKVLDNLYATSVSQWGVAPTYALIKEDAILVNPKISNLCSIMSPITPEEKAELYQRLGMEDKNMIIMYDDDPVARRSAWLAGVVIRAIRSNEQLDTIARKMVEYLYIKPRPLDQKVKKSATKKQTQGSSTS